MAAKKHRVLISTKKHYARPATASEIVRAVGLTKADMREIRASLTKHGLLPPEKRTRAPSQKRRGTSATSSPR